MNSHYENVKAAAAMPSKWTAEQLREMGELNTLIQQHAWDRPEFQNAPDAPTEFLRYILSQDLEEEVPQNGVVRKIG
jgi:hypothetical protein